MIWKNPFHIRQAEKVNTASSFLQLFSSESLEFIREQSFSTVQFVRSSPGAGKTTVFNAMQPHILGNLSKDTEHTREFYEVAERNNLIEDDEVKLLSCIISCAKNYDLIDELFKNGRRQQVFFALVNVRIVVLMLKSIMILKGMSSFSELASITFADYPEECLTIANQISNGQELFAWAQKEERRICQYLDNMSDAPTNFSLNYGTLFFANLFAPYNVLFNKTKFLRYSLIIFDDVQKLTEKQRRLLITTLYTLRPNVGVWIGERLEALSSAEIISSDGSDGREYQIVDLEEQWKSTNKGNYKKILTSIADRRVKFYSEQIGSFEVCLENRLDHKKYDRDYKLLIQTIRERLLNDSSFGRKYHEVASFIDSQNSETLFEKAISYVVLDIAYRQDVLNGQLTLIQESLSIDDFRELKRKHAGVPKYYMSIRTQTPYYYGFNTIKELSSFNIELFLALAGAIFEQYIAKTLTNKAKRSFKIKPHEQEQYLRQVANQRFAEIPRRFEYGENIQNLLQNLAHRSLITRDRGTNPYAGGAATGVAILKSSLKNLDKSQYAKLSKVLSDCISSNYLEKRWVNHGGKEWMILYYNRLFCLYFNLPLEYGGWFRANLDELNTFINYYNKEQPSTRPDLNQLAFEVDFL